MNNLERAYIKAGGQADGELLYQEWITRVHIAEEWQYLIIKTGRMACKSDLDAWLMQKYNLTQVEARSISNQTTEGLPGEPRPFLVGRDGVTWYAKRPEPTWKLED